MWGKSKIVLAILSMFFFLFVRCGQEEAINEHISSSFADSDLTILNQYLDLPKELYNYANPDLPTHYVRGDALEIDNTPEHNPITDFGATLGRVLFYDKNLSADNSIACASCHKQSEGFSDKRRFSQGINGQFTKRNSMTLINARFYENGKFFWDERAATLEEQALMPIQDHTEMGMNLGDLEKKLANLDYYEVLFEKAFEDNTITSHRIALALSQFMRSIVSYKSKFDEGLALVGFPEDEEQMPDFPNFTSEENIGMDIFYRGRKGATCLYCHGSPQHVNDAAKNNGLDVLYTDKGKGSVTGKATDQALFKVPSLRNVALTAPYMHDGRFATLMDVIDHYSDKVNDHPNLNFRLKDSDDPSEDSEVLRLDLTQAEKKALVAFLHTLTDNSVSTDEKFSDPFR